MHRLQEWIAGLSQDAIRTQEIWNRAYEQAREADALIPPELYKVREYELSFQVLTEATFSRQFELRSIPLNLHYLLRFQTRTEHASSIRVLVTQSPLDPGVPLPE